MSSTDRMPPPTVSGKKHPRGEFCATTSRMVSRFSWPGGDVEEGQLIGAGGVVYRGLFHRVPGIAQGD